MRANADDFEIDFIAIGQGKHARRRFPIRDFAKLFMQRKINEL